MVCKECGSYNAENLSVCKVCGAKLREDDTGDATVKSRDAQEDGRPSRDFVKAPSWPTRAYSGAPEKSPISSSDAPAPSGSFRPTIPARAAGGAAASTCPHCGKPSLPDAPFCPYCGQKLGAEAAVASAARPAAKAPVPQPSRRPAPVDDDFDEDDYDEDEEDYKPSKQPAKRGGKMARREPEGEELDEYDDEYDEEYDDEMPPKRGKGTVVLFWGLIVLLLALIVVFGLYIAKKNFDGDVGKMFASIGSVFNKDANTDVNADPSATDDATVSQMYTASISEYTDPTTSEVSYDIDIAAPTGSTIRIITNASLTSDTATVAANDRIILRIARDVFMPNEPVDNEVVTITPNIQAISPDGQTMQISVPDVTVTVPVLSMTISEPAADTVNATVDNSPIPIMGQVNNYDDGIAVFINDEQVYVDSTGMFTSSYTPKQAVSTQPTSTPVTDATAATSTDPSSTPNPSASPSASVSVSPSASVSPDATTEDTTATGDETSADSTAAYTTGGTETITIEARKNNCVTARKVITVEPYVMQTMAMVVTNDLAGLSSDTGSVTVTGTITPGAKITATSSSTDVTFGEPTVTDTGTFSMAVSIAKVGAFDIAMTGKLDGYYDGTATVTVERPPSVSSSAFKKAAADLSKNYEKISGGTTTSGDFVFTGKITEIIAADPYTIFRVQLSDGNEVIVANRSAKSTINSSDLKEKKQIAGTLKGLYTDGKTPYIWGWFIWNK
ncbi:MAG: zinc ribbon domain-containing protein [Eubacteriales bacterium]|nr:zinc ribbon domain-containing protein [Eubacteriales bacterium]